jgi:hypothetical protein
MRGHRKHRVDLDAKITPPQVDDPEEALRVILGGQGAKPEDWNENEAEEA